MSYLETLKQRAQGSKGKPSETAVQDILTKLGNSAEFDWSRIYDARSAGGRFPARPGDFEFFCPGVHGLIEVKELKHAFRLPSARLPQLPKLRKRQLAGGEIVVVIFHTQLEKWRAVPVEWLSRNLGSSWDLREFPYRDTLKGALGVFSPELYKRIRYLYD
jgi:hypothetical protein